MHLYPKDLRKLRLFYYLEETAKKQNFIFKLEPSKTITLVEFQSNLTQGFFFLTAPLDIESLTAIEFRSGTNPN